MASRIQEGGGGMGSSGGFKAKAARVVAGITGRGAKQVAPTFRQMGTPPPPPGVRPFNPNTPPKVPTSTPKKQPHVSEKRNSAIGNQNPPVVKTSTPKKNPTKKRGPFLGRLGPGNWTGE